MPTPTYIIEEFVPSQYATRGVSYWANIDNYSTGYHFAEEEASEDAARARLRELRSMGRTLRLVKVTREVVE